MIFGLKLRLAAAAGLLCLVTCSGTVWPQADEKASEPEATPPLPVSIAREGLPLALSYRLRQGFGPDSVMDTHDRNLYYHLHWEEFIPHNVVSRNGPVKALPYQLDPRVGRARTLSALGELELDALIADPRSRIQGFVVLRKGMIVYEAYPGMRDTDNHIWMSGSKTVASLLVGLLEADGRVDVNRPVDAYLPELAGSNWEGIRVIDILDMASGLDIVENAENLQDETHWFYKWADLMLSGRSYGTLTANEVMSSVNASREPGETFEYSSLNTHVLGLLVERLTGRRLADYFAERVWSRLGAEGDAVLGLGSSGEPGIFAFVSSRLRDKARYGLLYTPSWKRVTDERIIPQALVEKTQTGCRPELYQAAREEGENFYFSDDPEAHCNSRQWDAVYTDGDMYKSGLHGQGIYVSPTRDVVIAWYSTSPYDWQDAARAVAKLY